MDVLTLDVVKQYLRYELDDVEQSTTLMIALGAGVDWVEGHTGVAIQRRTVRQRLHRTGDSVRLTYRPAADAALEYHDSAGAAQTMALRLFGDDRSACVRAIGGWPAVNADYPAAITYTAGFADTADAPDTLLHGVLLYAGMFDQMRNGEDMTAGFRALEMLLEGNRVIGL